MPCGDNPKAGTSGEAATSIMDYMSLSLCFRSSPSGFIPALHLASRTPPFPSTSRLLLHCSRMRTPLPSPLTSSSPRSPPLPPDLLLFPLLSSSHPCSLPLPPALLLFSLLLLCPCSPPPPLLSSSSPCSPPHPAALLSFPPSCNQQRGAWVIMPPPNEQMLLSPRSYPSPSLRPSPPLSTSLPQQSCLEEFYAMTHSFTQQLLFPLLRSSAIPLVSRLSRSQSVGHRHTTAPGTVLTRITSRSASEGLAFAPPTPCPLSLAAFPPLKELPKVWSIDIVNGGDFPPLKELSKEWGIDIVNGGDCADSTNFQVIRECDDEGFIVSI
ncbi:unnamed protein product, partial [Closterium sp. NIES-65]